jgi:UDP-2-acetamido-3-amino-2,3-dideoxy-glucuronate N-acetyltransferase
MTKKQNHHLHPSSYIDKNVKIGKNTKIWHFCNIMNGASIGKDCILGQNIFVGERVKIGNRVKIQNNVSVFSGVEIEDDVFLGPSVTFTNVKKPRSQFPVDKKFDSTRVKKGTTIGANSTIISGVTIGEYAFIGAGSVVTKSVDDYSLVYGNPAKKAGFMCICGIKLNTIKKSKVKCSKCNRKYSFKKKQTNTLRQLVKRS